MTFTVRRSITVMRPVDEVYALWRDVNNYQEFMPDVISIHKISDRVSEWAVRGPLKTRITWISNIVTLKENEIIAWRTGDDTTLPHEGLLLFKEWMGHLGTEIFAEMKYRSTGGILGKTMGRLMGRDPEAQLAENLLRAKQLLETGVISTIEGQATGSQKTSFFERSAS